MIDKHHTYYTFSSTIFWMNFEVFCFVNLVQRNWILLDTKIQMWKASSSTGLLKLISLSQPYAQSSYFLYSRNKIKMTPPDWITHFRSMLNHFRNKKGVHTNLFGTVCTCLIL
jgi:hypothetical protein